MNMPLVTIQIEGFKHTLRAMLAEHLLRMDSNLQAAVDAACTPEKIKRLITETAEQEIAAAIKSEMHKFYAYGEGQKAVAEAVAQSLRDSREGR